MQKTRKVIHCKWSSLIFVAVLSLTACDRDNPDLNKDMGYLHGAFITNEGAFGNSNGSVSYFDTDSAIMINHVFESVNGRPLGDVVQSIGVAGDMGFIVVNNSQKVEVVDLESFQSLGAIEGLQYPRYFLGINDQKGYLTDGNLSGSILVIDLESLIITDTIPCGFGPERMVRLGNRVFVANSGGWGIDSTLTVIDTQFDQVTDTWTVGYNPADLILDQQDQLWVLCKGKVSWNPDWTIGLETPSQLLRLNPASGKVTATVEVGQIGDFYWPQHLGRNKTGNLVYYLESDGIHSVTVEGPGNTGQILVSGSFYGFGVDPDTDLVYALFAPSFTTSGLVLRYQANGTPLDSLEVGIGPSQVVFN